MDGWVDGLMDGWIDGWMDRDQTRLGIHCPACNGRRILLVNKERLHFENISHFQFLTGAHDQSIGASNFPVLMRLINIMFSVHSLIWAI